MRLAGLLRVVLVLTAVGSLELLCRAGVITEFTLLAPSAMAVAAARELTAPGTLDDLGFTLTNTLVSAIVSIVGGFALGTMLHATPRSRHVMTPLLASWYAVPTFVFYPLLIVLLGLNRGPLIALGVLSGIVAMIVSTLHGLDRVPRALPRTGRAMRMDPVRIALLIRLPAATPHLFTGAKLAVAYSIIGVVASEFILATAGIGRRIVLAFNDLDNNAMYGTLFLLLVAITLVNILIRSTEQRLYALWGRS